jgi:hypothetical protein
VIRPPQTPGAEPIPPRTGLALPPAPETSPLPGALQPSTQTPDNGPKLDDLLRNAVGNQPIKPGVKMRDQGKSAIPPGHTPVESTAMNSFKYDPDAQELHVASPNGTTYIYGDVSPEQATTFQNADSKGRAWGAIRNSNPMVGKILNASTSRVAVKPSGARSAAADTDSPAPPQGGDDLMSNLLQMLNQAKAKAK